MYIIVTVVNECCNIFTLPSNIMKCNPFVFILTHFNGFFAITQVRLSMEK